MVKTSGKTVYSLDNLWKDYGLQYNKLDICDKLMIYGLILDCYNLETFEKGKLIINLYISIYIL